MANNSIVQKAERGKVLSIVIPTCNMEKYLPACLGSVTDRLVSDKLEVIVVNDGSTDGSLGIIRQYEQKRPDLVKVIDKANGHYGSCVNAGLEMATGKYFKILDADDWFDTSALVALLQRLETCDTDMVVTLRVDEVFDKDRKVDEAMHPFSSVFKDHVYRMDEFYLRTHVREAEFGMNGLAYKTSLLRDMDFRLPEGMHYTDTLYCFLPLSHVKDFVVYDLYLYHYRMGREGQSVSMENQKRNLVQIVRMVEVMFREMDGEEVDGHMRVNQAYFVDGAVNFCLLSLKMQSGVSSSLYPLLDSLLRHLKVYGVRHRLLERWYFKLWWLTGRTMVLDYALRFRSFISFK